MVGKTFNEKIHDIENTYCESIEENTQEELFEAMRDKNILKYRTRTIKAGNYLYSAIYPIWDCCNRFRAAKKLTSRISQKNLNCKNTVDHIVLTINHNFTDKDNWATVTYFNGKYPKSMDEAQTNIENYIRRLQYACKINKFSKLKYAYWTTWETEPKKGEIRCHHHLITNFPDRNLMEKLWGKGQRNQVRQLAADKAGYEGLVRYTCKDSRGNKKYVCSKNLKVYDTSWADGKVSKRRAERLVLGEISPEFFFEKNYKGYKFTDMTVKLADDKHVSGVYIYVRMRREDNKEK